MPPDQLVKYRERKQLLDRILAKDADEMKRMCAVECGEGVWGRSVGRWLQIVFGWVCEGGGGGKGRIWVICWAILPGMSVHWLYQCSEMGLWSSYQEQALHCYACVQKWGFFGMKDRLWWDSQVHSDTKKTLIVWF